MPQLGLVSFHYITHGLSFSYLFLYISAVLWLLKPIFNEFLLYHSYPTNLLLSTMLLSVVYAEKVVFANLPRQTLNTTLVLDPLEQFDVLQNSWLWLTNLWYYDVFISFLVMFFLGLNGFHGYKRAKLNLVLVRDWTFKFVAASTPPLNAVPEALSAVPASTPPLNAVPEALSAVPWGWIAAGLLVIGFSAIGITVAHHVIITDCWLDKIHYATVAATNLRPGWEGGMRSSLQSHHPHHGQTEYANNLLDWLVPHKIIFQLDPNLPSSLNLQMSTGGLVDLCRCVESSPAFVWTNVLNPLRGVRRMGSYVPSEAANDMAIQREFERRFDALQAKTMEPCEMKFSEVDLVRGHGIPDGQTLLSGISLEEPPSQEMVYVKGDWTDPTTRVFTPQENYERVRSALDSDCLGVGNLNFETLQYFDNHCSHCPIPITELGITYGDLYSLGKVSCFLGYLAAAKAGYVSVPDIP